MSASTLSQSDSHIQNGLPRIVVVGRPNVGKSTLFNRMLGRRRAITDSVPGVTRDAVRAQAKIKDHAVELVDTGGYRIDAKDIEALVREKSLNLLKDSDLILFVCDVEELNAEDESFVEYLRPYSDKVIVVVNKVDNPAREHSLWNFLALGFTHVLGVSAAHGIGIDVLEDKIEEILDFESFASESTLPARIRLAVLGKPNTGKSTLSNRLLGMEASIVSEIPGTTRDVIEGSFSYKGSLYQILDTAGIRRKKKVHESVEYYSVNRAFKTVEESDVIFLMIDAEEGLTEQDKKISVQAVRKGKGIIIVLNKWDQVPEVQNAQQAIKDRTRFVFPILGFAPLIPISALKGDGVDKLLDSSYRIWKQLNKRVDTPEVNSLVQELISTTPPPRDSRGQFKVFYATQVSANPVRFLLFVNRRKGFPKSYLQYIVNNFRSRLGFPDIPISVDMKERSGHKK